MKKTAFILFLFISGAYFCQPLLFNKAVSFGGVSADAGRSIVSDKCGNVYTGGSFSGTVDFDPGPSVYTLSSTNTNAFLSKMDAAGNLLWARQIVGDFNVLYSLCLDPLQNICMAASVTGTADLDPGPGQYLAGTSGSACVFYSKLDPGGNFISGFSFLVDNTGASNGSPLIKFDAAGNLFTSGNFSGTVDFDPGPGTYSLSSNGWADAFVCKFSGTGALLWARSYGGPMDEDIVGLDFDASNNVFISGEFQATVDFDPGPGSFSLTSTGFLNTYVLKLNAAGNFLWAESFGGNYASGAQIGVLDLAVDTLGNVYVVGFFPGTIDFDPGPATYTLNTFGSLDAFISKLDAGGNFLWARQIGGIGIDMIRSICVDKNNKLFALGSFNLTADMDPGPATVTFTSAGSQDIFLLKLDEPGNFMDAKQFGGPSYDVGWQVRLDHTGSVYMTGSFSLTADFDPGPSVFNLVSAGDYDVFVCQLSTCLDVPHAGNCGQSICSGSNANIIAISNAAITWYPSYTSTNSIATGSVLVTSTLSAGTYTFFATASTCSIGPTRTGIELIVNPTPTLSVSAKPATVCPGQGAVLSASGAVTYSWNTSQLTQAISVTPTTSSIYTVNGTNTLTGCNSTETVSIAYSTCTGLNENVNSIFRMYPNPVIENLSVEMEQDAVVTIYDPLGRIVLAKPVYKGLNTLLTRDFKEGVYLVQIKAGEEISTRKIFKVAD